MLDETPAATASSADGTRSLVVVQAERSRAKPETFPTVVRILWQQWSR
jgi:hypothetical protein